jgi:hypothetical protein
MRNVLFLIELYVVDNQQSGSVVRILGLLLHVVIMENNRPIGCTRINLFVAELLQKY